MKALPMGHMLAVQLLTCMQQGVEPRALTRCRHHVLWGQCRVYNTVVLSKRPLPCWVMAEQPQGLCTPLSHAGKAHPKPSRCTREFASSWSAPVEDEPQGWQPESRTWFFPELEVCGSTKFGEGNVLSSPRLFCCMYMTQSLSEREPNPAAAQSLVLRKWALELLTGAPLPRCAESGAGGQQHEGGTVTPTSAGTQAALSLLMT